MTPRIAGCALLLFASPAAGEPAPHPDCAPGAGRTDILETLGPRGELRFASGHRAVLDSLHWPDPDEQARERLARWLGQPLAVVPRGLPDRWGRDRVDAQTLADPIDLAGDLVAAGLAPVDAGEADAVCRPALLLVEQGARRRREGLWQADPPAAEDGAALRALAGRFAVIEGTIRHVGERSTRSYLDFVPRGGDGLTVTVTKRTWRTMAARGLTADSLRDKRVRVRGVIEIGRGPFIAAATPDAIEVLDEGAPVSHDAPEQDDSGVRR